MTHEYTDEYSYTADRKRPYVRMSNIHICIRYVSECIAHIQSIFCIYFEERRSLNVNNIEKIKLDAATHIHAFIVVLIHALKRLPELCALFTPRREEIYGADGPTHYYICVQKVDSGIDKIKQQLRER